MTIKLNRRTLLRFGSAATTLNLAALAARADDAPQAEPTTPMPPIEAYAAPPFVDEIALSPDGSRCALVTQKGDNKLLVHFKDDGTPSVLVIGPAKIRSLFFADNDHVVLVNSVTTSLPEFAGYKHEFRMARIVHLDTHDVKSLFTEEDQFYNIVFGDLQRIKIDGGYRVTASNIRMSNDYPLCLFSFGMNSARGRLMDEVSQDGEGWVVGPDGHIRAYSEFDDETKLWQLHVNTAPPGVRPKYKTVYKVKDGLSWPDLVGIGRDGASLVLRINSGAAEGEYHEIGPDGALGEALDAGGDDRDRTPLFHPATGRLAGFAHHDDWFSYDYVDPLMKKITDGLATVMGEDYRYAVHDHAEDVRKMIVYGENASDAGTYYLADFSTGDLRTISENYQHIPTEWITQKSAITYKAADGLEIHGYLTLPPFKSPKNLSLIVLPHGGPQVRDYIDFDWQTQVLASRGYAVLQPNYRGSDGYGSDFVAKGHGEWGRKMQTDLSDGVRWLAQQGTVDPKRVAILGASYGGYAALAGATLDQGVYRCAVAIAGPSDLKAFVAFEAENHDSNKASAVLYWKNFLGDPKTYEAISPARQAAQAYCPIMLIHGTDDTVVPIDQSRRMEKALKAAGKPVEFITYKGQDHWETVGSARIQMMTSALAFLDKHNPAI